MDAKSRDRRGWRRPEDFDLIDAKVQKLASDRRSIHDIEIKTFTVDDLKLLYKHYSNRPWAHLFEAQKEYRRVLLPMFDGATSPVT